MLTGLLKFDTQNFITHGREKECQYHIADLYREIGMETDIYSPDSVPHIKEHPGYLSSRGMEDRPNVTGICYGADNERRVMIAAHTDTMSIGDSNKWTVDPFGGIIKDGRIYGLGAGDNKFGIAGGYFAFKVLKECGIKLKKTVLLTAYTDEEYGGGDGTLAACLKYPCDAFNYKGAPLALVRLNWSTVFCFEWGYKQSRTAFAFSAKDAISLGADMVLVSLTLKTGDEANDARNVEIFSKLCNEAREFGLPVVGECFPNNSDNLSDEEMHDQVLRGTRILAELGADMIKTFHTYKFSEVVNACPLPILGLGGHTTPNPLNSFILAQKEIKDGCKGVVFGRNAIQRPDPIAYQRALCEVVKHNVAPEEAVIQFGL